MSSRRMTAVLAAVGLTVAAVVFWSRTDWWQQSRLRAAYARQDAEGVASYLNSSDAKIRILAVRYLGNLRAAVALHKALGDADMRVRLQAVHSVAQLDADSAAGLLEEAGRDPDIGVRLTAVRALARMHTEGSRAALLKLSQDADPDIERAASEALSPLESGGREEAVP